MYFCNPHFSPSVSISLALNSLSKLCLQIVYHQLSIHSLIAGLGHVSQPTMYICIENHPLHVALICT